MGYDFLFARALKLHENGKFDEAEQIYRQILETAPDNPDLLNLLGLTAQAKGVHSEAVELFYKAVKISPSHAPYYFNLAVSLAELHRPYEAVEAYHKVIELTPGIKEAWYGLGRAQQEAGNMQAALSCYKKASELDEKYVEPLAAQALLSESPVENLSDLLKNHPENQLIEYNLACCYLERGNFELALTFAEKVLKQSPDDENANLVAGQACRKLGLKEKSQLFYLTALAANAKSVSALAALGTMAAEKKDFSQAENYFKQALALDSDYPEAVVNYADMLYCSGRTLEAVEQYRKAVLLQPDCAAVSNNLGVILKDTGDYVEALGLFFNAYKKSPSTEAFSVNIYETLQLFFAQNREEAVKIANNWVKDSPDNPFAIRLDAAFNGRQVPDNPRFAKELFDNFAAEYDVVLRKIDYALPLLISKIIGKPKGVVWDLGCGTGLAAEALKAPDNVFIGVDVSSEMLKRAEKKGIYDRLVNLDILSFLKKHSSQKPALVLAADVFCYFGDLFEIFSLCYPSSLCFSVEKNEKEGCVLTISGRYQHNADYVKEMLSKSGYSVINMTEAVIRRENGVAVSGLVFTAC